MDSSYLWIESPSLIRTWVILLIVVCIILWSAGQFERWGVLFIFSMILIGWFVAWFYRYPIESVNRFQAMPGVMYSPSEGKVLRVHRVGQQWEIVIFLSPFDQHHQFAPISGVITHKSYRPGQFAPAHFFEKSRYNEKVTTVIQTEKGDIVEVDQVAGQLVRRIRNDWKPNDRIWTGARLGMICFGSQVRVRMDANRWAVQVREGDTIKALETILASDLHYPS